MATATLALVHGWGLDSRMWDPLRAALPGADIVTLDLGYFGSPQVPDLTGRDDVVAVGHSIGFLWLLHERPFPWRAIVSLSGFPRFTRAPDYPAGIPPQILDRMSAKLASEPAAVVGDFRKYCGLPPSPLPQRMDTERLGQSLGWLADWDERDNLDSEESPILALYSQDDTIVPPEMSAAAFETKSGVTAASTAEGGHVLPLTRPEWCARRIGEFLETLS